MLRQLGLRNPGATVASEMKKLGLLSFAITALIGLAQPAPAGPSDRSDGSSYPTNGSYDSCGSVAMVRKVQRALQEEGYYTGDSFGNFCFETRVAVRRYKRDKGLPIIGKIDDALLTSLGLR